MNRIKKLIPPFLLSSYHFALAYLGAAFFGFPAKKLTVIGVTGTDGKSTTVEMLTRILAESGAKAASTSSVWFQIGEKKWKNTTKMGMPGRFFLQRFLKQAVRQGCAYAVLEVSSEGILQNRHRAIPFHGAVFTNLSPEHIERHGSFEKYRAAKLKLFSAAKSLHVINADDENAEYFLRIPAKETCLYSARKAERLVPDKDVSLSGTRKLAAENIQETKEGTRFRVQDTDIQLKLLGSYNAANALAAIGAATSLGFSVALCKQALEKMEPVPGRMNVIATDPFTVLVDYAVTPKALNNLYETLQRIFRPRRMICVLGACGGGRDAWKRPILGKIAGEHCAEVIVTNEDPYDEDPESIMRQVAQGAGGKARCILDRREALKTALSQARPGDVVVATGKGSEDAIALAGGEKMPWNETEVLKEELSSIDRAG
ncbi:MAG: UDP-N-acetylmuramoyl-L-alanyl-D-glutamate--2,6-diaminopimelate ligase [Candidatus Yanofskybacteria bacterium]|nr:UDP-N-acetylmuramoyl-L-alanyl-D-glutamate--2,6-diaminopimelate ligase [Candidatus Yanofskybacteria bacterium]